MAIEGKPTLAVVAQALNDHLVDCVAERQRNGKQIDNIWKLLVAVAGTGIVQLLALCGWLFAHAYPPGH